MRNMSSTWPESPGDEGLYDSESAYDGDAAYDGDGVRSEDARSDAPAPGPGPVDRAGPPAYGHPPGLQRAPDRTRAPAPAAAGRNGHGPAQPRPRDEGRPGLAAPGPRPGQPAGVAGDVRLRRRSRHRPGPGHVRADLAEHEFVRAGVRALPLALLSPGRKRPGLEGLALDPRFIGSRFIGWRRSSPSSPPVSSAPGVRTSPGARSCPRRSTSSRPAASRPACGAGTARRSATGRRHVAGQLGPQSDRGRHLHQDQLRPDLHHRDRGRLQPGLRGQGEVAVRDGSGPVRAPARRRGRRRGPRDRVDDAGVEPAVDLSSLTCRWSPRIPASARAVTRAEPGSKAVPRRVGIDAARALGRDPAGGTGQMGNHRLGSDIAEQVVITGTSPPLPVTILFRGFRQAIGRSTSSGWSRNVTTSPPAGVAGGVRPVRRPRPRRPSHLPLPGGPPRQRVRPAWVRRPRAARGPLPSPSSCATAGTSTS
jgi:hypothetical protein